MASLKQKIYRAFQWCARTFRTSRFTEAEKIMLPRSRYELAAESMHVLTQAVEAAISEFVELLAEKEAAGIVSLLSANMIYFNNDEHYEEHMRVLKKAIHKANILADHGYKGYAQALGTAVTTMYLIHPGVTEALVLPELLRSYGTKVEKSLARLARRTGLVNTGLPDNRTARLFINWIEQQRVFFGLPTHIEQLNRNDIDELVDEAISDATPMYPVPIFYNTVELGQFLIPLIPKKK